MQIKPAKKKIIIGAVILLIAGAGAYAKFGSKPKVEYITAKAEKGKLIQTVSETGTAKAVSELNLNFLNAGKISKIAVMVGDKVKKDQVLAELDYGQLAIKAKQAEANLSKLLNGAASQDIAVANASAGQAESAYYSALADLGKIKKSVDENIAQAQKNLNDLENDTPGDITNYEQAVITAQLNLDNTKKTYEQSLNNKIDNALSVSTDKLAVAGVAMDNVNKILTDEDAKNLLSVKNSLYLAATNNAFDEAKVLISAASSDLTLAGQNKSAGNVKSIMDDVLSVLNKSSEVLNNCYKVLENSITSASFTQTELDSFKSIISGQQTIVSSAITSIQTNKQALYDAELAYDTNVTSAENNLDQANVSLDNALISARNAYNTAKLAGDQQNTAAQAKVDATLKSWELAKSQLAKIKAPARKEDVALAQADLDSAKSQIANSIIKAPIDGIVTKINYEIGEDVSPSKPAISMLGENNLEIEILVSEADISKVAIGQLSETTFDAFSSDLKFKGEVYFVEPAETIVQDVVYYKVKVKLTDMEEAEKKGGEEIKVKSGMTANVVITTAEKNDILIIPARAVVEKTDGSKIVRVLINDQISEVPAQIGLRGDEGLVEVIAPGLKAGDTVVTSVK